MADFGFRSEAADGYAQVDGEYMNYAVAAHGMTTPVTRRDTSTCLDHSWYEATISFQATPVPPLVAVRCDNFVRFMGYTFSGGNYIGAKLHCDGASAVYWATLLPQDLVAASSGDYALQVFNASGDNVFDSRKVPMNIRDMVVLSSGYRGQFQHLATEGNPYYLLNGFGGTNSNTSVPPRMLGVRSVNKYTGDFNYVNLYNASFPLGCLAAFTREMPFHNIVVVDLPW